MSSRGLPTNPRPRSKSAAGASSGRQAATAAPTRPALPSNPRARAVAPTQRDDRSIRNDFASRPPRRSDGSSVSSTSTSSSGSSFWSRGNTSSSAASSQTDLRRGDDGVKTNQNSGNGGREITKSGDTESEAHIDAKELAGMAWGRVTEAANVFTQEVSKVWANNITPLGGQAEETGHHEEETHLLRVMRAYHLSKARTPGELPDWLFSDKERGLLGGSLRTGAALSDNSRSAQQRSDSDGNTGPNSGTLEMRMRKADTTPRARPGPSLPAEKASGSANRLKMLRERRALPTGNRV